MLFLLDSFVDGARILHNNHVPVWCVDIIEVKIGMGKTVDMLTLLGHGIQLFEPMIVGLIM